MEWTKVFPTQVGWYWRVGKNFVQPEMLKVLHYGKGEALYVKETDDDITLIQSIKHLDFLWCGPIPYPPIPPEYNHRNN